MSPALFLVIISSPMIAGLMLPEGPRAYYVAQSLLVAFLLWRDKAGDFPGYFVRWVGILIQLISALYGVFAQSGAVEWETVLFLLVAICIAAEIILQSRELKCPTKN